MRRLALALLAAVLAAPSIAEATPCNSDLPVLFVVQDKSGSMNESPDPNCTTCATKWASSKSAVTWLANNYANRFRFGVEFFPHDSTTFNCTTGTTVAPMPSTPTQIAAQYAAVGPGGGTSTALSLDAARTYLKGLNLTVPAYVLLITDGLPNCNTSLNAATCQTTTPGCKNTNTCSGSSCCGLGAKDCIDDSRTRQAAADLLNAGFKVYVVGFGAQATGNNQTVLNGIASAGGTSSAYAANDQAGLQRALDQVAFNATTCCKDVCTKGATQCASTGDVKTCTLDPAVGCTNWTATACGAKATCTSGACVSCTDACTLGAARCSGNTAQKCVTGTTGCTEWKDVSACGYGQTCSAGTCNSCEACTAGTTRCSGTGVETCTRDAAGCTKWVASACAKGTTCAAGGCQICSNTCTAGTKRCTGKTPETCVASAQGCTSWQAGTACDGFCSGGSCGTCGTSCAVGTSRCNGNGVETCGKDANGCSVWTTKGSCGANEGCAGGVCETCTTDCGVGTKRCSGKDVEECTVGANGCRQWVRSTSCGSGEICVGGACGQPCSDACTEGEARCSASGAPDVCVRAATGCTVWRAQQACDTASTCREGVCRVRCSGGEIETCAPGYVCTGTPDGDLCLPGVTTEPAPAPSEEKGPVAEEPAEKPNQTEVGDGSATAPNGSCGCGASGIEAPAIMALLPLVSLLRRRRRASK